jgi:sugar phosphate isomerase/epimerase
MAKIPVGLELYSVRQDFSKDPLGTLKAVAAMGYQGVEFAGGTELSGALLRAMLDETKLVCCGWHTPVEMLLDDKLAATIALNKAVGNKRVIVPGLPQNMTGSKPNWLKTASFFNELADKLAPHDLVTGYHLHHVDAIAVGGERPWDVFAANTEGRFIMQMDTGNALCGGADPVALLAKYPGRAGTVHLKPYSPSDATDDMNRGFNRLIGKDELPWKDIFHVCETTAGTQWYIVEYEIGLIPPLEGVKQCLQALRVMGR